VRSSLRACPTRASGGASGSPEAGLARPRRPRAPRGTPHPLGMPFPGAPSHQVWPWQLPVPLDGCVPPHSATAQRLGLLHCGLLRRGLLCLGLLCLLQPDCCHSGAKIGSLCVRPTATCRATWPWPCSKRCGAPGPAAAAGEGAASDCEGAREVGPALADMGSRSPVPSVPASDEAVGSAQRAVLDLGTQATHAAKNRPHGENGRPSHCRTAQDEVAEACSKKQAMTPWVLTSAKVETHCVAGGSTSTESGCHC